MHFTSYDRVVCDSVKNTVYYFFVTRCLADLIAPAWCVYRSLLYKINVIVRKDVRLWKYHLHPATSFISEGQHTKSCHCYKEFKSLLRMIIITLNSVVKFQNA